MESKRFYRERQELGTSSVIKSFYKTHIEMDNLIEIFKDRRPSFIFEELNNYNNTLKYSMLCLKSEEVLYDALDDFYREKNLKAKGSLIDKSIPFINGVVGYISYEAVEDFFNINLNKKSEIDKYEFKLARILLLINHTESSFHIIYNSFSSDFLRKYCKTSNHIISSVESYEEILKEIEELSDEVFIKKENNKGQVKDMRRAEKVNFKAVSTKEKFIDKVERAREYICEGDIFQVVLSEKFTADMDINQYDLYKNLRDINKSEYKSLVNFKATTVVCSSPETLVKCSSDRIETYPIAGTRAIKNDNKDHDREKELKNDTKELSEHLMLVDLGRNDISKVSKFGSVRVEEFCQVKKLSRVMHLVSRVSGIPQDNLNLLDSIKATFPAGTVTGAPKLRAIQIIDELEESTRDIYAGSILLIDDRGNLDSCIAIRSIQLKKNKVIVQAGAGIVKDSVAKNEYKEIQNKSRALFEAIEKTYGGEISYDFISR